MSEKYPLLFRTDAIEDCDLWLGGTCGSGHSDWDWRRDLIKDIDAKTGLTKLSYYDPFIRSWESDLDWDNRMIAAENLAKQYAKREIYVLTSDMTGVYSIAEITIACANYKNRSNPNRLAPIIAVIDYKAKFDVRMQKSLSACEKLWQSLGGIITDDLEEIANIIASER